MYTSRHIIVTAGGAKWPKWRIYFSLHSFAFWEEKRRKSEYLEKVKGPQNSQFDIFLFQSLL
jgi:hypothetical protein